MTDMQQLGAAGLSCLDPAFLDDLGMQLDSTTDREAAVSKLLVKTFTILSDEAIASQLNGHVGSTTDATTTPTEWKERGNVHFKHQAFDDAIAAFVHGLRALVVNSAETTLLQAILYTNRCAAWQAKAQWKHAFQDATRAIQALPTYAKAYFRRAKVLEAFTGDQPKAAQAFLQQVLHEDDADARIAKDMLISQSLVEGTTVDTEGAVVVPSPAATTTIPETFHHPHVQVALSTTMGRSLQATQGIAAGTVLLTESPLVMAVVNSMLCAFCGKLASNPIPCHHCTIEIYCNEDCRRGSWRSGHSFECSMPFPQDSVARIYWRLLNRRRFFHLNDKPRPTKPGRSIRPWEREDLSILHALLRFPPVRRWIPSPSILDAMETWKQSRDVLALCSQASASPIGLVLVQAHIDPLRIHIRWFRLPGVEAKLVDAASWLSELVHTLGSHQQLVFHAIEDVDRTAAQQIGFQPLGQPDEFIWHPQGDDLTLQSHMEDMPSKAIVDTIVAVAALAVVDPWRVHLKDAPIDSLTWLFKWACQLPTNVLAITSTEAARRNENALQQVEQKRIGVGVYPHAAMINHACAPNAFVRFDGAALSIVASLDLARGDHVTISYGPHASKMDIATRRALLRTQYFFDCHCTACQDEDENASNHSSLPSKRFLQDTQAAEERIAALIPSKLVDAEAKAQVLLAARVENLPATHLLVGRAYDLLAQIAALQEDFDQAVVYCERSIAVVETKYGPLDAELGHELLKLAQLLYNAGRLRDVKAPLARARSALSLHLPWGDPTLAEIDELQAILANGTGR
ncbi:SET and MYND domain-containing protein 4 [Aphanomyces cochlioides]|nr:SET and MYND domain-containing protein 4 [Aphanomyces cochlioides]